MVITSFIIPAPVVPERGDALGAGDLAAVFAASGGAFPGNGCKSTLKEGIVYDVKFVVLAVDDPVTGTDLPFSNIADDLHRGDTLCCVYEQGPAGSKGVHGTPYLRRKKNVLSGHS
jgi:hypothetical protein